LQRRHHTLFVIAMKFVFHFQQNVILSEANNLTIDAQAYLRAPLLSSG
jgi:hypothetical protein